MPVEAFEEPGSGERVARRDLSAAALANVPDIEAVSLRELAEDACFEEAALGELLLARDIDSPTRFFRLQ
jgi:hypothetical protein